MKSKTHTKRRCCCVFDWKNEWNKIVCNGMKKSWWYICRTPKRNFWFPRNSCNKQFFGWAFYSNNTCTSAFVLAKIEMVGCSDQLEVQYCILMKTVAEVVKTFENVTNKINFGDLRLLSKSKDYPLFWVIYLTRVWNWCLLELSSVPLNLFQMMIFLVDRGTKKANNIAFEIITGVNRTRRREQLK